MPFLMKYKDCTRLKFQLVLLEINPLNGTFILPTKRKEKHTLNLKLEDLAFSGNMTPLFINGLHTWRSFT